MERGEILELIQNDPETIVTIIQTLEKRVAELERQLNMNSQNSSRPPSTDGFKRPQKKRKRTGKLPGGQEGHEGHTLEWCENPDIIKTYRASFCEGCGASLEDVPAKSVEKREDWDIPESRFIVTKHVAETVVCPCCGREHRGSFPAHVSARLQYGPNIRALMVYLCTYQLLPYERAAEIISDLYGCSPVKATLMKSISDCATNLEGFENQVKHLLSDASVLCADETGLRVEGKREWLHTASTDRLTLYGHHPKRGSEAMNALGVLPAFNGTMVHDCWSPYFGYICTHAVCNAHILRDLQGITENYDQGWSDELQDLLLEIYAAVKEAPESAVSLEADEMEDFRRRFDQILDSGEKENPQPPPPVQQGKRGRKKRTRAGNLILRCRKYRDEILRFMTDFRVPFTNNLAERDIRMVKVQQKISGTFRSREGATNFCRVRGYISTVRKNGESVLMAIGGAFRGEPFMPSIA